MLEQEIDKPGKKRKYDPEAARANIIAVATTEFADRGLSGARIDEIAAKTKTSKRMIYYYFKDKEGLYRAVLESAYERIRTDEDDLKLDHLPPLEALSRLVEFTFTHLTESPEFIRIVMIENIHHAAHLEGSEIIEAVNSEAIQTLERIYQSGVSAGVFRAGLKPIELHWLISALSFFNVSNRATFSKVFGWDQAAPDNQNRLKQHAIDMVLRFAIPTNRLSEYSSYLASPD